MYLVAPIVYCALRKFPAYRKLCTIAGFIVSMASLLAASFANTVPGLLATQGVLYAIGGSIHYFPAFLYLDEWFVRRRGLAFGIFIAGGGAAGIVIPLSMTWILETWGFRTAARVGGCVRPADHARAVYVEGSSAGPACRSRLAQGGVSIPQESGVLDLAGWQHRPESGVLYAGALHAV